MIYSEQTPSIPPTPMDSTWKEGIKYKVAFVGKINRKSPTIMDSNVYHQCVKKPNTQKIFKAHTKCVENKFDL